MKRLVVYNCDPTPDEDAIVAGDSNVGHTWLSVDDRYLGWGHGAGDPMNGDTVQGALLDTKELNEQAGPATLVFVKDVEDEQAEAIFEFYDDLVASGTGYNLGGSQADLRATNCTESVVDALEFAGIETASVFEEWEKSFPGKIPKNLKNVAGLVANLTTPNPNAFEKALGKTVMA